MTKDDFITKYQHELYGLLIAAITEREKDEMVTSPKDYERKGRFLVAQVQRAKGLLDRMFSDMNGVKP